MYIEKGLPNLAFPMRLTLLSTRLTPNQRRFELAAEMPVFLRRFCKEQLLVARLLEPRRGS